MREGTGQGRGCLPQYLLHWGFVQVIMREKPTEQPEAWGTGEQEHMENEF